MRKGTVLFVTGASLGFVRESMRISTSKMQMRTEMTRTIKQVLIFIREELRPLAR